MPERDTLCRLFGVYSDTEVEILERGKSPGIWANSDVVSKHVGTEETRYS